MATGDGDLLRYLQAPPALVDAVESLAYWRDRRRTLPWYRRAARRECEAMIRSAERRVMASVISPDDVPLRARATAAGLVLRTRAGHWGRRVRVVTMKVSVACAACAAAIVAVFDVF
jgi:hypothetical protein